MTATEVVQHQVDAYNARDLARFLAHFSETITIFRLPGTAPSIAGKAQLAEFYATQRFNLPDLRAEIVARMAFGNKVIDHERIHGVSDVPMEVAAVYEVAGGLIERAWFVAGA